MKRSFIAWHAHYSSLKFQANERIRMHTSISRDNDNGNHGSRKLSGKVSGKTQNNYVYTMMKSPVGTLKLIASEEGLAAILWENDDPQRVRLNAVTEDPEHPILVQTERELREYFAGERQAFSVKLDFVGTDFQKKVWQAMVAIPFGETRSYGQLARQIGNVNAMRAVGAANGKNPISIIGPCHRVIGASGKLTGYAGGLPTNRFLLALEADNGGKQLVIDRLFPAERF
jgi:methylated-DNA-[protein]-cysteine S-methyltransferase